MLQLKAAHPDMKIIVGNSEVAIERLFRNAQYPVLVTPSHVPELNLVQMATRPEDGRRGRRSFRREGVRRWQLNFRSRGWASLAAQFSQPRVGVVGGAVFHRQRWVLLAVQLVTGRLGPPA